MTPPRWIAVKVTPREREALRRLAADSGDTVGGLVREALYARFGVGEWPTAHSLTTATSVGITPP